MDNENNCQLKPQVQSKLVFGQLSTLCSTLYLLKAKKLLNILKTTSQKTQVLCQINHSLKVI